MALTVLAIGVAFILIAASSLIHAGPCLFRRPAGKESGAPGSDVRAFPSGKYLPLILILGLFVAIEAASVNVAYTLQIVPYVIAIKRLSIIFFLHCLVFSK
jgi:hypothetical protein